MPSGGSRSGAGRKSTWNSGRKFEDTATIRVPKEFKLELLEIAKKLDAGEKYELDTNSYLNQTVISDLHLKIQELENSSTKLIETLQQKGMLLEQVEKSKLELETKSKDFWSTLDELQQKNYSLQEELGDGLVIMNDQVDNVCQLAIQFLHEWLKQIRYSGSLQRKTNSYEVLALEKETDICEIVTDSKLLKNEIVTDSNKHIQMDLLDIEPDEIDEKSMSLKPLTSVELSERFNRSKGFVKGLKFSYKNRLDELSARLKQHDPQGVGWKFSDEDQKYYPIVLPTV